MDIEFKAEAIHAVKHFESHLLPQQINKQGFHKQIYVTRKAGEELDKTCLRTNPPRKRGWMFWASFYNNFKGPCLFWEKEWGTINAEGYIDRIVPIIDGYVRLVERNEHQRLQIMQDNAPGHARIPATGMPPEPKALGTIIPHMPGPVNGYEKKPVSLFMNLDRLTRSRTTSMAS
ncbi:hypothetical protein CBS76997_10453 [Aspergillus niger]|nr:hypothetical protein CBS11350_4262 [Aspergillus niger]KAI2863762.1 hypothetical protein CBS12448_3523 [Aspergillus niger]KAI2924118.1 hypothetical protein CBS147371_1249 [Aspergillus niger]KAI2978536.1 hypothetical protein CBS147324_1324 [Aspergillus niger]KAI3016589.1 hypothetical protein CBS147482_2993 [Aspergillus niger]